MDENEVKQPTAEEQPTADDTISKKVYDDMVAAYDVKVAELEKNNATLNKQVDDYSRILRNINVQQVNTKPQRSSEDIVKNLLGGIK